MRAHVASIAALALAWSLPAGAQDVIAFKTANRADAPLPASCRSLAGTNRPSGFYWVKFDDQNSAVMYCNNEVVFAGLKGGWTLVWSNLRGGRGKLGSDLHWGASIESLPRYRGATVLASSPDLQAFEVFTGLKWWRKIVDAAGGQRELLYEWAHDFADHRLLDRQAACKFDLNSATNWTITFNSASCSSLTGGDLPGLFTYSAGRPWTTVDRDNDAHGENCANRYSGSPWWYGGCWSGPISGGGETGSDGHPNGAYWAGSERAWGNANGTGAGNGWIYIR